MFLISVIPLETSFRELYRLKMVYGIERKL